ncbi:MAG: M14 family zinc carboxypeptidase, partial [Actinomycetes bacterium]
MRRRLATTVLVIGGMVVAPLSVATPADAGKRRPAVTGHRVIGYSIKDRPIHAWRVGNPRSRVKAVAIAAIHGDEIAPRQILFSIRDGAPVKGIDLWLIPTYNRDGVARGPRKNARGVDLNRNFPRRWAELDGQVESGRGPASERETRVLMRFLN